MKVLGLRGATFTPRNLLLTVVLVLAVAPTTWAGTPEAQTLEDLERVGAAIFAWGLDQVIPAADQHTAEKGAVSFDVTDVPLITSMDLEALLVPTYLSSLPAVDGWGNAYEYRLDEIDPLTLPYTAIRSAGADGLFEGTVYTPGFTATADGDLVFFDGALVRRPMPSAAEAPAYTLEILREIAAAVASWRTDQVSSPLESPTAPERVAVVGCDGFSVDAADVVSITADALEALLSPNYLLFLPRVDGWGHALEFRFDTDLMLTADWFNARSPGSDDLFSGTVYSAGFTTSDTDDIVAHDSSLVRRPELAGAEQTETLGDMSSIGTAIFSWVIDNLFLSPPPTRGGGIDVSTMAAITHGDLEALLVPFYLPCLPVRDFWGHDYDYWLDTMNIFAMPLTGIRSRGSDDTADGTIYEVGTFPADATENDLLWVDGFHIRVPDPTLLFFDGFESGDTTAWSEFFP